MGRNDLRLVLENETVGTEVGDVGKTFYRYGMGDFQIWFSQDDRNGNIYAAYMHEREDVQNGLEDKFEFYIGTQEETRGAYYPNEFQVRPKSYAMSVDEGRLFAKDLERACDVMEAVKDFFNSGKHFALYAKGHVVPHIKVSAMDYKGHVVCEELYRESDKGSAYHAFLKSHPEYLDFLVSAESVGLQNGKEKEPEEGKDVLISRDALLGDIVAYNLQHGRSWASMDDDWKKACGIIANYRSEDGDLVSREGLLDAILDQFGCDLAYYGGDLRYIQEAIEMIPAASSVKVDALIANASVRSEEENKYGVAKGDSALEK